MNLTEKVELYLKERRGKRSEKLRMKNLKSGKKPAKGWGKMVDTGFGGLNSLTHSSEIGKSWSAEIDTKRFIAEEQKRVAKEHMRK
ncbi:hypothetical protein BH747_09810 [Enterococcus villorum]|uniref:Uncharacterized protein n=2 Tax=Enterococcus villorum TaxID=112904 RepID=A0A1V8YAA1_9ENTE|nr:hypothetical protein [Enterococcus villorum]EOH93515.1 hypothetical protein UAO_00244 [Enterococcus villorum ATCC 700913]EOW75466.1 hypothetical protein I591_02555 [Enterococcus villorum ATCC 700913]OQO69557.1 hypothetical protein BH747_09810 [Enterococcus villorum]OQO72652.1 hypothetical protein BH744_11290 [Enterococcus villorum]GEL92700.1 hypothetical protein EVI01_20370 [Enterococcus villorum]